MEKQAMINSFYRTVLIIPILLLATPLQANKACNWTRAWVHVYPPILEVRDYEGNIRVEPSNDSRRPCQNRECDDPCLKDPGRPCLQLTLNCRVATETNCLDMIGQDNVTWMPDWDSQSNNLHASSPNHGSGKWHPLYLKKEQFTSENNNTLYLKPIAIIGNGHQVCADTVVTVVLRKNNDPRDGLKQFDFLSATKIENQSQLWITIGQPVVKQW